jgi:Flp pilus assembly protein TadB
MMTLIMLAGVFTGLGLLMLWLLLDTSQAAGPAALSRLDLDRRRFRSDTVLTVDRRHSGENLRMRRIGARVREQMEARGISLPAGVRADLSMVGRSLEAHLAASIVGAVIGFFVPLVLSALVGAATGSSFGLVPLWVGLTGALIGGVLPTSQVKGAAETRRRDFRHVVSSFLDLVAMNLSGGRGVPEALQTAARISDSWAMLRIRECLQTARLQGVTPWAALGQLGNELRVDELRDLAAALGLVAEDGAKVRDSLYARSESMRQRELADAEGRAQAQSQSMLVAQLLLCVGFLLFLIYPAIARVITGM